MPSTHLKKRLEEMKDMAHLPNNQDEGEFVRIPLNIFIVTSPKFVLHY